MSETIEGVSKYFLKINTNSGEILKKKHGSLEYYVPETADQDKGVFPQVAEIVSPDANNRLGVSEGDRVVCYHYINENKYKDNIYYCDETDIIALLLGDKLQMFHNNLLVEKIEPKKKDSDTLWTPDQESNECLVKSCPEETNLWEGAEIGIIEKSIYPFQIDGNDYYIVSEPKSVMYVYTVDEEMLPVGSFVMVKGEDMEEFISFKGVEVPRWKAIRDSTKFPIGKVHRVPFNLTDVVLTKDMGSRVPRIGDEVYFQARPDRLKKEHGQIYYFCNIAEYEEIKLIL